MVFTKIALSFALLMAGQTSGDSIFTNLRSGRIPAGIQPDRLAEIRELKLFESADRGRSWNEIDRITPDKDGFKYAVPSDGEYWYQVVVVNQQGKEEPSDIYKSAPMMKMIVDTKAPELKITSAQRQGDELVVSWSVREENPDPPKLKMEYRSADSTAWTAIALTPTPTGTAKTRLNGTSAVVVRLQFRDLAGNAASVETQVGGSVAAAGYNPPVVGGPAIADRTAPDIVQPPMLPSTPQLPPMPPPVQTTSLTQAPTVTPQAQAPLPVTPQPQVQMPLPVTAQPQVQAPLPPQESLAHSQAVMGPQPQMPIRTAAIASTIDSSQGSPVPPQAVPAPRTAPQVQYVNDPEIIVEYELSRVGSSGLGSVDVWLTRDGGATWKRYAEDDNPNLGPQDKHYQRTLRLPGEGTFGITLVVKSKAGLSKAPPRSGDAPEILIDVDVTPPVAELMALVPDSQRHDTVVLSWTAKDRKLDDKAFVLEWSEHPAGPWQTIAAGLPSNSRSYAWQPPAGVPAQVHLKLTVRDAAGNVAVAITRDPQPIDLNEPQGRLVRITPANKR